MGLQIPALFLAWQVFYMLNYLPGSKVTFNAAAWLCPHASCLERLGLPVQTAFAPNLTSCRKEV